MKRLLFFIAFMSLGTAVLIELLVRKPVGPGRAGRQPSQVSNVLNMTQVLVNDREGDNTRWELRASHAVYDENTELGDLQQVHFTVYSSKPGHEHEVELVGHSNAAQLSRDPDDVVLTGSVVLNKGSDFEIRSERIEYDAVRQLVISPGPTQVHSPQGDERGDSLRYSVPDQKLDLTSPLFLQ